MPVVPDTGSQSDAATTSTAACAPIAGNEFGIGKACSTDADCAGQSAATCLHLTAATTAGFCTKPCVTADAPGVYRCGLGAICVPRGKNPGVCAPTVCKDTVLIVPPVVEALVPCNVGQVNACGIGLVCGQWQDCAPFGAGAECPHVVEGEDKAPNFCVKHCGQDSDCCGGAFCWWRREFGHQWIGNCTPDGCKKPAL